MSAEPREPKITVGTLQRHEDEPPSTSVYVVTDYHRCQVYVSPTGRSVRFWLDGVELVKP